MAISNKRRFAEYEALLDSIPPRIRIAESRRRYLKQKELRLFLQKAPAVRNWLKDYILWGIHSGIRQEETRKMKWISKETATVV